MQIRRNCWGVTVSSALRLRHELNGKRSSCLGKRRRLCLNGKGGTKEVSGRWILINGSVEDSGTSVATVWVSNSPCISLSLQSSSSSLYQTLLHTAVLHCGLLNLIIGPLPASFTPLLFLLKTLMTLILQCSCIVYTHPGVSHTHPWVQQIMVVCLVLLSCLWMHYESQAWNQLMNFTMSPRSSSICMALRWAEHCCWSVIIFSGHFSCRNFDFNKKRKKKLSNWHEVNFLSYRWFQYNIWITWVNMHFPFKPYVY